MGESKQPSEKRYVAPAGQVASGAGAVVRWLLVAGAILAFLIVMPQLWRGGAYEAEAEKFLDLHHVTLPEGASATAIRDDELSDYFFVAEGVETTVDGVTFVVGLADGDPLEGATEPITLGDATGVVDEEAHVAQVTVGEDDWTVRVAADTGASPSEVDAAWDALLAGLTFAEG